MRYRLLKHLSEQPQASQRHLSEVLGVSVGSLNYCVNALIERGWVKATNFRNSHNKLAYAYLLTPSGIEAKTRIAMRFLQRKLEEYEALEHEIAQLRSEVAAAQAPAGEAVSD
ncbi:MarR family EPS-associated transcriptional regulator [Candidatus Thiodictyon syntrophicum]|jgi:EPS-associated MarR family transcriptional regulator|uniref:MarR family EPS-associated transcriptional regulator n=2 Tax=Candidatus Thiodictyon syntrophicum TaxID=1166950 RepID=A0A2K8UHH9_9GAMM|nr:MarR family EPS-associated transcriptional regulator [Candidatus Thiodictyon syntrophicum]AUB84939.1 MarR family EPS-associated transcriptional regulator [Candidatus Thiodictyon syntrophicum]AUB84940.1 MarR family EPS-associated transcriptional regulator [Candidatus Thiodictyon syntrophicum]